MWDDYSTHAENPFILIKSGEFREELSRGKYSDWFLRADEKAIYALAKGVSLLGKEPDSKLVAWATRDAPATTVTLTATQKQALKVLLGISSERVEEDESLLPWVGSARKLYGVIWEVGGLR